MEGYFGACRIEKLMKYSERLVKVHMEPTSPVLSSVIESANLGTNGPK